MELPEVCESAAAASAFGPFAESAAAEPAVVLLLMMMSAAAASVSESFAVFAESAGVVLAVDVLLLTSAVTVFAGADLAAGSMSAAGAGEVGAGLFELLLLLFRGWVLLSSAFLCCAGVSLNTT
jgi:hypothetical protein